MEYSISREDNSHSASQKISCILWNPKFRYHVQKSQVKILICKVSCYGYEASYVYRGPLVSKRTLSALFLTFSIHFTLFIHGWDHGFQN